MRGVLSSASIVLGSNLFPCRNKWALVLFEFRSRYFDCNLREAVRNAISKVPGLDVTLFDAQMHSTFNTLFGPPAEALPLKNLVRLAYSSAAKWYTVGVLCGLNNGELHDIAQNKYCSVRMGEVVRTLGHEREPRLEGALEFLRKH